MKPLSCINPTERADWNAEQLRACCWPSVSRGNAALSAVKRDGSHMAVNQQGFSQKPLQKISGDKNPCFK